VNGEVRAEHDFGISRGLTLQLVEDTGGENPRLHILKEAVYQSNLNQMFVLGRYDPGLFRPVLEAPRVLRVYEVIF